MAQGPMPDPSAPVTLPEGIQIGLSTDEIRITADFAGANLTIFGSVDNPDPPSAAKAATTSSWFWKGRRGRSRSGARIACSAYG